MSFNGGAKICVVIFGIAIGLKKYSKFYQGVKSSFDSCCYRTSFNQYLI